jgi:hypothetical protein
MRLLVTGSLLLGACHLLACSADHAVTSSPGGASGSAGLTGGGRGGASAGGATASGGTAHDTGGTSASGGTAHGTGGTSASGGTAHGTGGTSASGGTGQSGVGGDAGVLDGGNDASDAGDASATGIPAPARSGYIGVGTRSTDVAAVFSNSAGAGFNDGPGNWFENGCKRDVSGACTLVLCDLTNGGNQRPPPGAVQSAGTLTIGGTTPAFSLTYDTVTAQYAVVPAVPSDHLLFTGGETITFSAAGADVPAFTATLVAPAQLTITSPALPVGAFAIDTSKDLVFVWTGASVGKVTFNIGTTTTSTATAVARSLLSCRFDASALTGTIPIATLRKLPKTDAATTARLGTDHSNTTEILAGDYSIALAVGSAINGTDGKTIYTTSQVTIL